MLEKLTILNNDLEKEFGVRLSMGVGINTGPVFVGNMGSDDLLDYTIIGDSVNLASRVESLCSRYGLPILVSGSTVQSCGDNFAFQLIDVLRVKGKSKTVHVYSAMRWEEAKRREEEIDACKVAMHHYTGGRFEKGAELFRSLSLRFPQQKIYSLYEERCATLGKNPPEKWDGVWTLTSK